MAIIRKHRSHLSARQRCAVSRLHKLLNEQGILRASLVRMKRCCGRAYCRCNRSKRNWHSSWYVVQRHDGSPRLRHVNTDMEESVRKWIDCYKAVKRLLDTISDAYWNRIKKKT